jgi:oxygen-independent coproporphyrinogen-3 oxidase
VAHAAKPPIDSYLQALKVDLGQWFDGCDEDLRVPINTLFVGGGTPSLLGVAGMASLIDLLQTRFEWDPATVEFTAEANPNSLSLELATDWRRLGVNRLSLGVQSFQEDTLTWLGRLHTAQEAVRAIGACRDAGFERINVDLIFGLPPSVRRDWTEDLNRAVDLGVTHLSAYGLTAEPRTPLGRWVDLGRVSMPGDDRYAEEYLEVSDTLVKAGLKHYEVSNFAEPGQESRHNWLYWDGSEYLGLGPSAHSYLTGERVWNVFRWDRYREAATRNESLREGQEILDHDQRRLERIWLGLRTSRGLDTEGMIGAAARAQVDAWRAEGWINEGERLRLTPAGWLRLDALATEVAGWPDPPVTG